MSGKKSWWQKRQEKKQAKQEEVVDSKRGWWKDPRQDKALKKESRRSFRLDKIAAVRDKFYAVASKRKWLFFVLAAAVVLYLVVSNSGFGSSVIDKIKSLF